MLKEQQYVTTDSLSDLIDSGRFQQAEELICTQRLQGPMGLIHLAEVHTYFNRLEAAGDLLKQLQPQNLSVPEAARHALARGEWHYWRFEYEPAEQQFRIAEWMYRAMNDEYGMAKVFYNLGRLQRREARLEVAQESLEKALELMKDHRGEKKDFLKALIDFNQGVCAHQCGQLDKAADLYTSAMVTLNMLERGVYHGMALSSYGMVLMRKGLYEQSLSVLDQAIAILQGIAAFEPLGIAMNNKALTLIRLARFDEAKRLLRESIELHQRAGHTAGVSSTLETLAELSLESKDLLKAETYATEAIKQAELSHNDLVKAEALIALGRVALKRNDFYAAAKPLNEALEIAEKLDNQVLQTTALIYLAESEFYSRPVIAQERLTECRQMLEEHPHAWLTQELERTTQRASGERIRVTPDNWLMINGNLLPNWYEAKVALETFLMKNALRQSGGNMSKAGQIIGISKVHAREKTRAHKL